MVTDGAVPPVMAALVTHAAHAGIVERAIGTLMNLSASGAGTHITVACFSCCYFVIAAHAACMW